MKKPRSILCCPGSEAQNSVNTLLPAEQRYLGSHVSILSGMAKATGFPFYLLSGVFGLIPGSEKIPYYDHLLTEEEVSVLAIQIETQIRKKKIKEIAFYTKAKPQWLPYRQAMEIACEKARVELEVHELDDDA